MENEVDKVVVSNINQPVRMSLPNVNLACVETIKHSALYQNAAGTCPDMEKEGELELADAVTTNGWDTVSICRVTALNERIRKERTYPADISEQADKLSVEGEFDPWQVVTGGDGRNVKIRVPMKSGTYIGMNFGKGKEFDLTGISVDIYVKLSYFPMPDSGKVKDGSYDLLVAAEGEQGSTDPIAAVVSLSDPDNRIDSTNKSILRGLFETWLNRPENLQKFDTLFSTVLINNMGKTSDEYKWLRATAISYAYTDKNTEESSIFGILCMTNDRSYAGLPNQLPAISLESDDNALFLISREVFVKYQLLPSLPYIFPESTQTKYVLDKAGTTINASNLQLDSVKVGAIDYHPVAKDFEITFDESYIRTTARIHTPISSGIDAYTTIVTKQKMALGTNSAGEQVMVYEMVGDPVVENNTEIATWIVVTEAIIAVIASVVTGVTAKVASKLTALIVGIIVAAVVALIGITIHVIIERVIAGGATDNLPSIEPMVKIGANQVKWPFCEPDAFVLTDIDYLGALIFKGKLQLAKGYSIVNNRLVYSAL